MDAFGVIFLIAMIGFIGYKVVKFHEECERDRERQREHEEKMRKIREAQLEWMRREEERKKSPAYQAQLLREQEQARRRREEAQRREAEQKRQEELKRRQELKAKFHYITLGGNNAAYRYDYYPKNRYPYVDSEAESNRRAVWNFKDGARSIGVNILSDFLEGNYSREQMGNLAICVIPASTSYKNETRYKDMCEQVAAKYPIKNGFGFIEIIYDRSDSRESKSSNTIANLSFSNAVYGKDVILFDDVTTRGTSFIQVANELKKKGARSVYGVFIGRTVGF